MAVASIPVRVGAKALLAALIVAVVSVPVFFVVISFQRWDEDAGACGFRRENDPEVAICMEDRRNSRWGPWHTLGKTADITYEQD